jgi:peptide/nickel transport system ATP-binding protein
MTKHAAISPPNSDVRPALEVRAYSLAYETSTGLVQALSAIDLAIARGRTLGLVGESGSGKTSLAWAIMRYLPRNARELGGELLLAGDDLRATSRREIADIRGRRLSMVFQDPSTSLNPTLTLGDQLTETLIRHRRLSKAQAWSEGEALLARTGITRPAAMMKRYPHEASGGEKQRVVIATAFACDPECILFDEPTTALDVITAGQILDIFQKLQEDTGVAALYISHDLALVSRIAHEVAVIHRGVIVERGETAALFRSPQHDYTRALIAATPRPEIRLVGPEPSPSAPTVLETRVLTVRYGGRSILQRLLKRGEAAVEGARKIDLTVREGEILGLVGESGSGKSTIARAVAGIADFSGTISFDGHTVTERGAIDRAYRRAAQIVFQNPDSSLNPRQRVGDIIARPLKLYDLAKGSEIEARVAELLTQVRLPPDFAKRYPHQLSGGEKQRVAIARAFAARPKLVICDEITSSLDVSVQAAVARLLIALQSESNASCLFITHDLNLVRQIAHRIAVIYRGDLVDLFDAADFEADKRHPYTRSLLAAMPPPVST